MPTKYRLVQRKNMSKEVPVGSEKLFYAQSRATGTYTFDQLCEETADSSTASSGDVKLVVDRMTKFAVKALERGEVVQLGEFGNFQLLTRSSGCLKEEDFVVNQLRKPSLCFRPGSRLRKLMETVKSERFKPETVEVQVPCDRPHGV